jgi:hypothetical protein
MGDTALWHGSLNAGPILFAGQEYCQPASPFRMSSSGNIRPSYGRRRPVVQPKARVSDLRVVPASSPDDAVRARSPECGSLPPNRGRTPRTGITAHDGAAHQLIQEFRMRKANDLEYPQSPESTGSLPQGSCGQARDAAVRTRSPRRGVRLQPLHHSAEVWSCLVQASRNPTANRFPVRPRTFTGERTSRATLHFCGPGGFSIGFGIAIKAGNQLHGYFGSFSKRKFPRLPE